VRAYRPFGSAQPVDRTCQPDGHDATRADRGKLAPRPLGGAVAPVAPTCANVGQLWQVHYRRRARCFGGGPSDHGASGAAPGAILCAMVGGFLARPEKQIGQPSGSATAVCGGCFASSAIQPALKTRQID
jgi:hypothetical protein